MKVTDLAEISALEGFIFSLTTACLFSQQVYHKHLLPQIENKGKSLVWTTFLIVLATDMVFS